MSMLNIGGDQARSKLTNIQPQDVQPNAVDLRLGKVLRINPEPFLIDETRKVHRGSTEIPADKDGWYYLDPGHYEVVMENVIKVGNSEAGWVITRSTLNRNGVFLTSGLYDSMYHGAMAAVMHVTIGPMRIKRGTRIGQYLCFEAQQLHDYAGDYGFDAAGKPKKMEEKYHK